MQATLFGFTLATLAACATSPSAPEAAVVATVIVQPRAPATAEEILRTARAQLGNDAGLRYVRPLAGDAHLLYMTSPASSADVPALIERLRASNAFRYVELDSTMKAQ